MDIFQNERKLIFTKMNALKLCMISRPIKSDFVKESVYKGYYFSLSLVYLSNLDFKLEIIKCSSLKNPFKYPFSIEFEDLNHVIPF